MSEYLTATAFGAVIIVVFAWDQFNRPSYEKSRELTRLIELLTPSDLRRRTVYWRAYVFYTAILLLVYATLCAYGTLLLPVLGLDVPGTDLAGTGNVGASEAPTTEGAAEPARTTGFTPQELSPETGSDEDGAEPNPAVPLAVSLAMVGLAPSVPILLRFEEKIRFAAHRLSGIPTRLVAGSRQLRQRTLDLVKGKDTYLIPQQEWNRLEHYEKSSSGMLDDPLAFYEDMAKIIAFRSWILQEKLQLGNLATRDAVSDIEGGIGRRIERLMFDIDTLTGFGGSPEAAIAGRSGEQARVAWENAAKEADGVAADVCVLMMLYVEHGILPTEEDADRIGWGVVSDEAIPESAQRQRYLAQRKLMGFVSDAARWVDRESISLVLWGRATAAALLVSFCFGIFLGRGTVFSGDVPLFGDGGLLPGITYVLSAALTYALALLAAIGYQQAAFQNGTWRNVFRDNWARWTPQLLVVFIFAGIVTVVCHVGYNIYATIGVVGWEPVREKLLPVLRSAVEYEGPAAMRGPVLAILVILIIDAWRNGKQSAALEWLPSIAAVTMFCTGLLTRTLSSQVAATARGARLDFETSWPVILEAGILAGLIGMAVGYFVRATLLHEFPRGQEAERDHPPPKVRDAGRPLAEAAE